MTADELIALMAPETLVEMIHDIEDSAGPAIEVVRNHLLSALIANVGEKETAKLIPYTVTVKLDHSIPYFVRNKPTDTPEEPYHVECRLCRKTATSTEACIDTGWIPSYWSGDIEVDGPVCPDCVKSRLTFSELEGDYELTGTQPHESHD